MPVKHVANGDGTVTQLDADTGQELVTFPDPDGSFTRDHIEPAAASAAQPAPQGTNAERTWARAKELAPTTQVLPDTSVVTPEAPQSEYAKSLLPPTQPSATKETAGIPASGLPVAAETTQGLAEPDRAARAASMERVGDAQERAAAAVGESEQAQLAAREQRMQAENDRALGRYASDLELHELAKQSTLEAEQEVKRARAAPIDPAQALGGSKFFFAILAGVGASLSNFGAALMGRQGTQDTNVVDDIVADGVRQQMADRQLKVEGLQDSLESRRKDELRLSIQANASLEKWFESRAAVESAPEVRAAYASHAEERRAAIEADQFKLAEGQYNQRVQQRAAPKPTGPGKEDPSSKWNAETREDQAALAANGVDQKEYAEYGKKREALGADATLKHVADLKKIVADLKEKGSTDVPGVGPIDQATQSLLRSNDASKVQQALGQVVTTFVKNRSGAAVTDKEREYLSKIIIGTGGNQEASLMDGLRHIEAEVQTQLGVLDNANSGAQRAYQQIQKNRASRAKLSDADRAGMDAQTAAANKPPPAPAPPAPAPGADPVRAVKTKGITKALNDWLSDDSGVGQQAPGSAL
jgi:hypothetical protein